MHRYDDLVARIDFLQALWRQSPFGMLHLADNGEVLNANPAFCVFLGHKTDAQLVGRKFWELMPEGPVREESVRLWAGRDRDPSRLGLGVEFSNEYCNAFGEPVSLLWQGYGCQSPDGSMVGYCRRLKAES